MKWLLTLLALPCGFEPIAAQSRSSNPPGAGLSDLRTLLKAGPHAQAGPPACRQHQPPGSGLVPLAGAAGAQLVDRARVQLESLNPDVEVFAI
ncbi:hypothetical protein IC235_14590 [Hymenobacter sp. BT664]|uniref:Uncharacterized protein n=1 Tax=Hymenobacter montanus TaxID=2771359 RepID=A0A927GKF7_9BACT|nr:hypothetical protein [Hymenobacter montanus]MBD2769119.1 hypothetical protein [Hymenobacter montanus]